MSGEPIPRRLGYLLKHVEARYRAEASAALAEYRIDSRELATLACLEAGPSSQQEAAARLGLDRTTMVALCDALEGKGLVVRRPHPADRRRNAVELTDPGRRTLREATVAADDAERRFLAPLGEDAARLLKDALRRLLG